MHFSVIIVNYNNVNKLIPCINSIIDNTNHNIYEIIIVDNGSNHSDIKQIKNFISNKPNISLINLEKNYGPSHARDVGIKKSKYENLCFLDNDTEVTSEWSTEPLQILKKKDTGIIQCKLVLFNDPSKIDYVGDFYGNFGFLVQKGPYADNEKNYMENSWIFSAKSAAIFLSKKAYFESGGLDKDFFIYVEETDLAWRMLLNGYKNIFCASSVVKHHSGSSNEVLSEKKMNYMSKFHGCKNYIMMNIKNLERFSIFAIVFMHIFCWFFISIICLLRKNPLGFVNINKAIFWNIVNLKKNLNKRKKIFQNQKIKQRYIFKELKRSMPISYYLRKIFFKNPLGNEKKFL